MTLANDSMAWTGRYPGRLHNDVLNKGKFRFAHRTGRASSQASTVETKRPDSSRHHCIAHNLDFITLHSMNPRCNTYDFEGPLGSLRGYHVSFVAGFTFPPRSLVAIVLCTYPRSLYFTWRR